MREYGITKNQITKKMFSILSTQEKNFNKKQVTSFFRSNVIKIKTYSDMVMEVAELAYNNPDVMLFLRGQSQTHIKESFHSLYPSIYRDPSRKNRDIDFNILEVAASNLLLKLESIVKDVDKRQLEEIRKIKILQYAILQHYEVCKTPLLDVTHSLSVACSFASIDKSEKGYVYVLGLPYITGRISVNSEDYITNIRLLSISCSLAKRPFFQEGYLVQTEFARKQDSISGLDFNRRLLAIYEFENNQKFWEEGQPISSTKLYPPNDTMAEICKDLRNKRFHNVVADADIGDFLLEWAELEELLRNESERLNIYASISDLRKQNKINKSMYADIDKLRMFRNKLVHYPKKVNSNELKENKVLLYTVTSRLNQAFVKELQ